MWVQSLGWEDSLEAGRTTHSSILAWKILWTEELGRLHSMGSQRAGHDKTTNIQHIHALTGLISLLSKGFSGVFSSTTDQRRLFFAHQRRSNQSILREINPEYSLESLMLKLKLQYFGHLTRRANSLEKTLTEGRRRRG